MSGNQERTYLMIKPDGVQRGLVGEIIKRFEQKGFKLIALKFVQVSVRKVMYLFSELSFMFYMQPTEELLQKHYADLSGRPFFAGLVKYMASGPVVAMVMIFYCS